MNIPIKGIQKTTLLDFPERVACTLFIGGCNFRCGYCYNADLVLHYKNLPSVSVDEVFGFLAKRGQYLQGVCITGGEPTLYPDLIEFCKKIKHLGYDIKLDTNGTNPDMIRQLIESKLIDYIAMDVKTSLTDYDQVASTVVNKKNIQQSINIIKSAKLMHEFRITADPLNITQDSIKEIAKLIKGSKRFAIQQFRSDPNCIGKIYQKTKPLPKSQIDQFKQIMQSSVDEVIVRGIT